ncbi:hypothetical protein RHSIM_Rhsim06G0132500 [Rhododendron simsii]|uniref:Uncharacterized protein n=1 Tax=Rhododendron simsii TaxID=118357 RepID=A0A834GS66_RHOSS|nr:hypothetical protein RHSIM_Rhsim06G0132500 [Rhododendron simsii]
MDQVSFPPRKAPYKPQQWIKSRFLPEKPLIRNSGVLPSKMLRRVRRQQAVSSGYREEGDRGRRRGFRSRPYSTSLCSQRSSSPLRLWQIQILTRGALVWRPWSCRPPPEMWRRRTGCGESAGGLRNPSIPDVAVVEGDFDGCGMEVLYLSVFSRGFSWIVHLGRKKDK